MVSLFLGGYKTISDEVCAKCECSEKNTVVTCDDVGLTEIPHRLPRNLSKLILKWNFLVSPDEISFSNCSNLQYLNLVRNSIYKHLYLLTFLEMFQFNSYIYKITIWTWISTLKFFSTEPNFTWIECNGKPQNTASCF